MTSSLPRIPLPRRIAAALIVGFGIAAATHLAIVFVFFVVNGSNTTNIVPISDYFAPASLVLFVLASLAAFLDAARTWYVSAAVGLVVGILSAVGGTTFSILAGGTPWSTEVAQAVVASLLSSNLAFVVATVIAFVTVGRRLWPRAAGYGTASRVRIALVRPPSSQLQDGEVTHIQRTPVNFDLAQQQWQAYVAALAGNGFAIEEVAADHELPDSVFVEDVVVMFGGTAVVTSPGAESRRYETDAIYDVADRLGLQTETIELPGTLDGGDVLIVGTTAYVGRGGRTNAEGIRQLRAIVAPLGFTVVAVPVTKALHLKSAVTALPDGTVIGYPKLVDNPNAFDRFLAVPEAAGAAVVVLGPDAVLMASSAPKSAALIADLGYRVVTVDIGEFEKLEGCVTCLSVRIL